MSINSRSKGKAAELEFCNLARAHGFPDAARNWAEMPQSSDVIGIDGVAIEVRRRENLSLAAWSKEIEAKTPAGIIPAVAYRRSNDRWRVSLPAEDFFALLRNQCEYCGEQKIDDLPAVEKPD